MNNCEEKPKVIALAGNPNVGKSTVFNSLTGMHQHTGNWPGKTVASARGLCGGGRYELVDTPGAYSLSSRSPEEEIARDFICFGKSQAVIVVCDATCLERNLNLVLQTRELGYRTLVCVNLMDEAKKKGIELNLPELSECLGVPVIGITAKNKSSRKKVLKALDELMCSPENKEKTVPYPNELECSVSRMMQQAERLCRYKLNPRWLCLRLLEGEKELLEKIDIFLHGRLSCAGELLKLAECERERLGALGIDDEKIRDMLAESIVKESERISAGVIKFNKDTYTKKDRALDRLLTGRLVGYPVMLLLLALTFYITIVGANYPSDMLAKLLFGLEDEIRAFFSWLRMPEFLSCLLVDGVYRVLAWVVSVMLPPMAIFFPLFTLLEDAGYLPRVAYNLDNAFHKCKACGKQALTMCMGFGCNAAGVIGCRIINSPRERLLAILTNSFVPCNGRFPMLIAVISMFFVIGCGKYSAFASALMLTLFIVLSVILSLGATKLLSCTALKGEPSSFILEMPPYRTPRVGQVLIRSIFDRTLFVLGRAAAVAAPAGAILYLCANISIGGESIISICAGALDPLGRFMGLDGVILLAFILALPANEIVLPIIIMIYSAGSSIIEPGTLEEIRALLIQNGWGIKTALCFLLFALFHWPCSTTLLSIKKETGSTKWAALSALLPTAAGIIICALVSCLFKIMGI